MILQSERIGASNNFLGGKWSLSRQGSLKEKKKREKQNACFVALAVPNSFADS